MQLTINVSDTLPNDSVSGIIKEIENIFSKKGISFSIRHENPPSDDPWDNLNIEKIAVDTGIEDFAENHDHYLYGTAKRS